MTSIPIRLILFSFLFVLFIPCLTSANTKTFIKEYTYQASEDDSRNSSRTLAIQAVKRLLLEELGTYLESETEVKNFQLTKDRITALTAGIVQTEIVADKWDGDSLKYWLKAKITADPDEVVKSIDAFRKDRAKISELEELRQKSDNLLRENERLKKELLKPKSKERQNETAAYNKTIKDIEAIDWFQRGYAFAIAGNLKEAINAYNRAIILNPKDEEAHINRGFAYDKLDDKVLALKDYNRAIELNPKMAAGYYNRGTINLQLRNYTQAIIDFNRAIELNPERIADVYCNWGNVYNDLGDYYRAIKDYDKAIQLNPNNSLNHYSRGVAYQKLGKYQKAIEDYDKAIEIDPKKADAYFNRASASVQIQDYSRTEQDLKIAARLGIKEAQDFLRNNGRTW